MPKFKPDFSISIVTYLFIENVLKSNFNALQSDFIIVLFYFMYTVMLATP